MNRNFYIVSTGCKSNKRNMCEYAVCKGSVSKNRCLSYTEEGYQEDACNAHTIPDNLPAWLRAKFPFVKKHVIVWYREDCVACKQSKDFFNEIIDNRQGFEVVLVQATNENRMSHVLMVPMYDIVYPNETGGSSIYGKNTHFISVMNNDQMKVRNLIGLSPPL